MTNDPTARWFRYALLLLVALALTVMALWPGSLKVDSAKVERGTVTQTLEAEGLTRLRDPYAITAPVAAMARRITLAPGDPVRAGQVLVMLDPVAAPTLDARSRAEATSRLAAAQAQLQSAQAEARSAQAIAAQAQVEAERLRPLAAQGMVSAQGLLAAETAWRRSELEAQSAHFRQATAAHQLEAARAALAVGGPGALSAAALQITSPVDGVVLRRPVESARPVMPGDALMEIGDPAALEVAVDVLSSDAVQIQSGMAVTLLRWGDGPALQGRVRRVEPGAFTKTSALGVEEQRVWVVIDISSPHEQWARLGEAYRVHSRFVLREVADTLRAPSSAVFRHNGEAQAFRMDGGKARLTAVTTGLQGDGDIEILEGLSEGDSLVIHPPRELADGARVHRP
ncbi:MAG: efflux RND transporter periplasmic adaptor subunit [Hydrogenophaga sp.]|uniref:efflux RND transporter periplasmic adaptor subunit n=1 Tax=Hydrogenophaga sp. TaxID=1904254 RepID=UPI001BC19EBA|nr:efflux RND transporter periplasmic adaptor subunit [Hydrogenophaga sp.]MBS3911588.1 efflux RND transporter periplasmic adaptor subunit [Hydrogenophaga sp.]MDO9606309.1 efflux RND transporter periplasmic adaptor subunit [Hydrogenophaga sp.]